MEADSFCGSSRRQESLWPKPEVGNFCAARKINHNTGAESNARPRDTKFSHELQLPLSDSRFGHLPGNLLVATLRLAIDNAAAVGLQEVFSKKSKQEPVTAGC